MKVCSKCGLEKPFAEFNKCKKSKDGFQWNCKKCKTIAQRKYYKTHTQQCKDMLDKWKEENPYYQIEWRKNNQKIIKSYSKKWYRENEAYAKEKSLKYKKLHPEIGRKHAVLYKKLHPEIVNANKAKRKAKKLNASLNWGEFNNFLIQEIYSLSILRSKLTGIIHHVDHIIPLRSEFVCGLHVGINLRVITAEENLKKGNKFSEDNNYENFR